MNAKTTTPRESLSAFSNLDTIDDPMGLMDRTVSEPRLVLRDDGRTFSFCGGECLMAWRAYGHGAAGVVYLVRDDTDGEAWERVYRVAMAENLPHPGPKPSAQYRLVISA